MNLPKLLSLLDAGERGQYADLQWFYHYMERSDAMVFAAHWERIFTSHIAWLPIYSYAHLLFGAKAHALSA